jgi:hypothetical protein
MFRFHKSEPTENNPVRELWFPGAWIILSAERVRALEITTGDRDRFAASRGGSAKWNR